MPGGNALFTSYIIESACAGIVQSNLLDKSISLRGERMSILNDNNDNNVCIQNAIYYSQFGSNTHQYMSM